MSTSQPQSLGTRTARVWHELQRHHRSMALCHMRDLFDQDPERFSKYSIQFNDILLDYSKNIFTEETLGLLFKLAEEMKLGEWIEKMFTGEAINNTEQRSVLHVALRTPKDTPWILNGVDINEQVHTQLAHIREISDAIRCKKWCGATHEPITDVVNIGIGGSDLGPKMVTEALKPYALHGLHNHFISNLDENHVSDILADLKPETTLFIISSKSFSTIETMFNAETARDWFLRSIGDEKQLQKHFLAVSNNTEAAIKFGISPDNVLKMWDWVGGRYSLWSAIGLPIAIAVGMDHFESLLQGAYEMDRHFRTTPFQQNLPVIMALLGIWYNNFYDAQSYAIFPYDEHMRSFPSYLQQADMESNGKSVDRWGETVSYSTGPIIFGEIGIRGQHAFYQLLHQGTKLIPSDFLAPITNLKCIPRHHRALMANVFAQTEALMKGRTTEEARAEMVSEGLPAEQIELLLPYRTFEGNKPTNTLLFQTLDPRTLGSLIALYEHKIFVQGVIWNINSFDQWGVELGKKLALDILKELDGPAEVDAHDSSTNGLINHYLRKRPKHQGC